MNPHHHSLQITSRLRRNLQLEPMTPYIRLLIEKTTVAQLAQEFPAFAGDLSLFAVFITAHNLAFHMLQVPCHQGDREEHLQIWRKAANILNKLCIQLTRA